MTEVNDAIAPDSSTDGEPADQRVRRWPKFLTYNFFGMVWAFLLAWQSFTPSLIPRSSLFQGLVSGVAAVIGYLVGLAVWWVVVQFTDRQVSDQTRRRAWRVLLIIGGLGSLVVAWVGRDWQDEVRALMDMPDAEPASLILPLVIGVLVFVLFIAIGRGIRRFYRWVMRLLGKVLPVKIAKGLAFITVALLISLLVNDVIVARALTAMDATFATANRESFPDTGEPTSDTVSGGPSSEMTWESLGRTGRDFVAGAPDPEEITAYTAEPAESPVRAYVGLEESTDARVRASEAVAELDRLGGFDREVLIIGNTTGSGWVDDQAIWPLEFMYGGDTASVAIQYSYLPSWLSFLVDKSRAQESGRALFDAVYGVWSDLPEETRPKLVVFGESLGSFGGETAFSGSADMANRTDGIVFMGPPNDNRLWTEFEQQRAPDSPQWQPVYQDGETVRFIAEADDLSNLPGPWETPRVLYIQHASDPITWWSPNLMLTEPEWLQEPPGPDRSPAMRWIPFVTFFQVSADLAVGNSVPDGHGHKFGLISVDAWAAVLPPDGWTTEDSASLKAYLAENPPDPID